MYADEDTRRLLESRHDIAAAEKPADISPDIKYHPAITASRDELFNARGGLQSAAAHSARERSETDAERAKLEQAIDAAKRRYAFVRNKVQDALLNVDPDAPLPASEIERRQRLFQRVFRAAPSDLDRLGQGQVIEAIGVVTDALDKEPELKALGFTTSVAAAHTAAKNAAKELSRENNEDAQAMDALRAARASFDRASDAHTLLVKSLLVRVGRADDLGQFILAHDSAYAARRAAKAPISQEIGASELDAPADPPADRT